MKPTCDNGVAAFENAVYIGAQAGPSAYFLYDPAPLFRKEFTLDAVGRQGYSCGVPALRSCCRSLVSFGRRA